MIDWTLLRSKFDSQEAARKFEYLAFLYVQDIYPNLSWEQTELRGDGNRDAYASVDGDYEIWEEAKYRNGVLGETHKRDRALERKEVDSTILSGLIYGKVHLIIFVSNANMPSEVMMRCMLGARIRGIEVTCALSAQLENWLAQHQSVYQEIFGCPFSTKEMPEYIASFSDVQFFDLVSTDFSPLQKKKFFYTGELCMLEVVIYTSEPISARFAPMPAPFCMVEHPDFMGSKPVNLTAGLSSLVFLVQMKTTYRGKVNIGVELDGKLFYQLSNQITVLNEPRFHLSYSSQLEVIGQIRTLLLNPNAYQQGTFITLYAQSSMGKSYILQQLLKEFSLKFDISMIEFDSNQNNMVNYSLLCKSVLFFFYGNIFWDIVSNCSEQVMSFKEQVLAANTGELFSETDLSQMIDGCFDANIASSVIQSLLRKIMRTGMPIIKGRRSKVYRILLLDDFQYLSGPQETFAKLLLGQLAANQNSNILIISATEGKFQNKTAESYFLSLTPNRFALCGLTKSDKEETLRAAFQLSSSALDVLAERILPDSPLLAGEVLRNISAHLNGVRDVTAVILAYTDYLDTPQILQNKFLAMEDQFYLLDIIYKFKKGLPLRLIKSYPAISATHVERDIRLLLAQNLIALRNHVVLPYHDYYIAAYQRLRGKKIYNTPAGLFFEYLLEQKDGTMQMDGNQILSLLLRCGKQHAKAYQKKVKEYVLKYIHETQFGAALQFCEYYYEQLPPLGARTLSHEEAYFLYLYADCLVHCDHRDRAYEKLSEVYRYAEDDTLEKYEAGASLLNQLFWRHESEKVIADSLLIQAGIERIKRDCILEEDQHRLEKAYDTCFNRRMAAHLLMDHLRPAQDLYRARLMVLAADNGQAAFRSTAATLIMDYARGIAFADPKESRRLMGTALNYFKTDSYQHYRRIILCQVDLAVLRSVADGQYDPCIFRETKEKLLNGGFLSEYLKAVMKHAACKLIDCAKLGAGEQVFPSKAQIFRDLETELQESLLVTQLHPKKRELFLVNSIKAFITVRRGDMQTARSLLESVVPFMDKAGESYQKALRHNLLHLEDITTLGWYTAQTEIKSNVFLIDSRFW